MTISHYYKYPLLNIVERRENTETRSAREKTMTFGIPCLRAYGFGLRLVEPVPSIFPRVTVVVARSILLMYSISQSVLELRGRSWFHITYHISHGTYRQCQAGR